MGHGLISDDIISRIKERVDITDIVSHHVSLTKTGQNLKGLCPFHADKNPSFTVSPTKQIFHCFACGAGGNVFTFLTRVTGASFPEVVRDLGRKVGIEISDTSVTRGPHAGQSQRIEQLNQAAAAWFAQNLGDIRVGAAGREYLKQRGIEQTTIERFGIGVAPAEWDGLLKALVKQGFAPGDVATAGLVVARDGSAGFYDRFRGRVMFTITDLRRRIVGFGGRVLGDIALNASGIRLFILLPTLFVASSLASLRILYLRMGGKWEVAWSLGISLVCVQLAAGLHYWPLTPTQFGLLLIGPLYGLINFSINLRENISARRATLEPSIVIAVCWGLAIFLR